jgi:hypothetical protein
VSEGYSVSVDGAVGARLDGTLADAVARAASGMTNMTLARRAGMSTRTLRAILDPSSGRRFGRATLDKLDNALGWGEGKAWSIYRTNGVAHANGALEDGDAVAAIKTQVTMLSARLAQLEQRPMWESELIEACRPLSESDRATVLALARRLAPTH